jgi:hypothetical protein
MEPLIEVHYGCDVEMQFEKRFCTVIFCSGEANENGEEMVAYLRLAKRIYRLFHTPESGVSCFFSLFRYKST